LTQHRPNGCLRRYIHTCDNGWTVRQTDGGTTGKHNASRRLLLHGGGVTKHC